ALRLRPRGRAGERARPAARRGVRGNGRRRPGRQPCRPRALRERSGGVRGDQDPGDDRNPLPHSRPARSNGGPARRRDQRLLDRAEVREALGALKTLDRDEWATAWSAIGDRHMAQAKRASDRASASEHYKYAFEYYLFARFPLENSPGKVKAYDKALEAFAVYAKLQDPAIEIVRIPFEGKEIVGTLRLPKGVRPAPLVLTIGGLDARKENASFRSDAYLAHGVGTFSFDMPGTGQSTIRQVVPGAEREFTRVLDYIATRHDLDAKRVVVYGGSWGGHWAARLAYLEGERIRGAVV